MSETTDNTSEKHIAFGGSSNGDHDAYSSSYYSVTIANGQIIKILEFTNDVRRACKDYLQHTSHHGTLNYQVSNGSKYYDIKDYPVPLTSGTTTSGCVAWKTTVDSVMSTIEDYITSFKTSNSLQLITASSTWDFLVKCFHATHRIAEQRFSYYKTLTSSSTTTVYSIGLLDEYQSLSDYSNSVKSLASSSSIMLTQGSKIVAVNTSNAIHALMEYNANHEIVYDHGERNKKNNYSQYVWGSTYYECDEGPFYEAWMAGHFNHLHVYYKMKYAPSGVADYQDKGSIWHHNYSDDHGHVYNTKTSTTNELIANNPSVQEYNIHSATSAPAPVLLQSVSGEVSINARVSVDDKSNSVASDLIAVGTVAGTGTYKVGASVQLNACASNGYEFIKWENGSTDSIREIIATSNITVTAYFKKSHYVVDVILKEVRSDEANLILATSETYEYGDVATLLAPTMNGYEFVGWEVQDALMQEKAEIEISVVGNATYVALYKAT